MTGEIAIKVGDKITTDHIMPAGSRLKYRSNIKKYSEFVFEGVDPEFPKRAAALRDSKKAVFVVAGESYGQGSSREHAAICPMYLGVKAIIARSFERIHAANLVNFGILPLVFADQRDYDRMDKNDVLRIDNIISRLSSDKNIVIENMTKKTTIEAKYSLSGRQKSILKAGGLLNMVK
jgi:aconitate hydratase